ncbi:LysR family transcriptional regulator [Rhodoferax koreense]|uniref:LysR family transcriptional regulator n=1 Tax=Rhodoferax koreensis TaxID=1842727 RepID=A0A1P8JUE6_9BURK|nr:LysR substrate-binding domain-containing protein [Rhodoferax koreense]APW37377.1 LysR family transcriptional regulator [Rhodoferax koreense]
MDLRDLHYFEVIAELEHIGRATERLHRSQPALTGAVRRLEETYGANLIERTGRGIRLTAAGKTLLKWAQRARLDLENAHREIRDLSQGMTGEVKLGIVPTAAQFLLPPAARTLLREAPGVKLKTTVALGDVLRPKLTSGDIDLMVGTESFDDQELSSQLLAEDQIVVAAAASHPLFERPALTLRDLVGYPWVLQPPGAPIRDWLDQTFDRHHLPRPEVQVESTMLLMLPTLIEETGLLSFISRLHLRAGSSGAQLREVVVRGATMRRRMVVSSRRDGYLSPAADRLVALLATQARRHPS